MLTCFGVDSSNVPTSFAALGEEELVERQDLLVEGNDSRVGSAGRIGRLHGALLPGTREPGDENSRSFGRGKFHGYSVGRYLALNDV